jgi:hypothetical protein
MPDQSTAGQIPQSHLMLKTHELAVRAMTRIEAHEAECGRRDEARVQREAVFLRQYDADINEIKRGLEQLHGRISGLGAGLQSVVRGTGGAAILGLCGLVGWLLLNGRPWD